MPLIEFIFNPSQNCLPEYQIKPSNFAWLVMELREGGYKIRGITLWSFKPLSLNYDMSCGRHSRGAHSSSRDCANSKSHDTPPYLPPNTYA